jgi:glycosyltransferase involved in cell wall biosynthesis
LLLMEKLAGLADAVTGSNRFVVDRFNGVLVPHGKDTDFFDPVLYDRLALRREWGLGQYKVLMFLGTPHRHKGLEELVTAVRLIDRTDLRLVLVGVGDYPVFVKQLEELGEKSLIFVGSQPFSSVPKFLSMADLVVIPQQDTVVY